jgi:hypothetical protein
MLQPSKNTYTIEAHDSRERLLAVSFVESLASMLVLWVTHMLFPKTLGSSNAYYYTHNIAYYDDPGQEDPLLGKNFATKFSCSFTMLM